MPTLIPTDSNNSLLSHPLFVAQSLRLGGQLLQPMPQQVYSLPLQPMPQQQQSWMPPQPIQIMLQNQQWRQHPLRMPPPISMQSQTSRQTYYPPYQAQPMPMLMPMPMPMPMLMPMPMPMPMQQVEETRVIQSINQNPNGTSDYITIPKSMFDQILREKHFNEVPGNCDLKYSLTQNNHGQTNYNFHVIQRPSVNISLLGTMRVVNSINDNQILSTPMVNPMLMIYRDIPPTLVVHSANNLKNPSLAILEVKENLFK